LIPDEQDRIDTLGTTRDLVLEKDAGLSEYWILLNQFAQYALQRLNVPLPRPDLLRLGRVAGASRSADEIAEEFIWSG
jgi:hypothetical protein